MNSKMNMVELESDVKKGQVKGIMTDGPSDLKN